MYPLLVALASFICPVMFISAIFYARSFHVTDCVIPIAELVFYHIPFFLLFFFIPIFGVKFVSLVF